MINEPQTEFLDLPKRDLREKLLPRLLGTVFHVTSSAGLAGIRASGLIRSNQDGSIKSTYPQSEASYGRRRGYVCLFDLRSVTGQQLEDALMKFDFLDPSGAKDQDPAFLFLAEPEHKELIPCTTARGTPEVWVPYIESWYPRDLPITRISRILEVRVAREPDSPFIQAHKRANATRGGQS